MPVALGRAEPAWPAFSWGLATRAAKPHPARRAAQTKVWCAPAVCADCAPPLGAAAARCVSAADDFRERVQWEAVSLAAEEARCSGQGLGIALEKKKVKIGRLRIQR